MNKIIIINKIRLGDKYKYLKCWILTYLNETKKNIKIYDVNAIWGFDENLIWK